jgi:Carboxypeptidase regulatory-like domain
MPALSARGNTCKRLLILLLVVGCGGDPPKPSAARQFKSGASRMGVVSGFVLDDETGAPIASAQISVEGQAVRARPDGSFEATVPAGRARVEVKNDGFIKTVREVAVGDIALSLPFKLARKEDPRPVGSAGGTLPFREASLTVPPGAFGDGTMVSMTYLGRVRVAVTANQPQFIDSDQTPRRVVATVDLDASAPPAMPVMARVPVPADATMDSVRGFALSETGEWTTAIMPLSVSGGFAEFPLTGNTRFGVGIDTRKADGKNVGYLVTESGDAAMSAGQVLAGGSEVMTASRAAALVDPQGSRIEVAPASRARTEVPAGETGVPGRVAAYAGMGTLLSGSVKVLVPKGNGTLTKLILQAPVTKLDVKGTAFTVTTCESDKGSVDVLSVTEGTVHAEFSGGMAAVNAGDSFTFCTGCAAGSQPLCGGGAADAGAQPPPDATASMTHDAQATSDMEMVMVKPDTGVAADAGMMMMSPPDAGTTMSPPDAAVVMPPADAGSMMTPPPDGAVPPPDADVVLADAAPPGDAQLAPDMAPPLDMMVMPPADAALPPPDMMAMLPADAAPPPVDMMMMPPPDAAPPPSDTSFMTADVSVSQDDAAVTMDGAVASLTISPPAADYGTVQVSTASPVIDFTVSNNGDTASGTPSVSLPGDFFVETTTCTGPVAAHGSCVVRVKMIPSQLGPTGGSLVVAASPGGSTFATLSGYGADAAKLDIMPAMQSMGNAAPGLSGGPVTFTIKNIGGVKSGIPAFNFAPTNAPFTISQNFCTAELDSGGTCQVTLTFSAPATFGQSSGQLVASASPGGNATADLTGNSTYVEITPSFMDFGSIMKQSIVSGGNDFTVWHLGQTGAPMILIMSAINGTNAGDFMITNTTCANGLTPGGSCTVSVGFTPGGTGTRVAQLDVAAHLATGAPQGTDKASLSGAGI